MQHVVRKLAVLALGVTLSVTAWAQSNAWSKLGTCSTFVCDAVTVAHLDDDKVLLQFTEYAGHYMSLTGTEDSEDPTLIELDQVYFDGHQIPQTNGQCVLIFKAPGELDQVICPSLTFTVTEGPQ
jgi:hypothetical protein